jgi:DNA-binding beta-propeller fold protein YncE
MNQRSRQTPAARTSRPPAGFLAVSLLTFAWLQPTRGAGLPEYGPLPLPAAAWLAPARVAVDGQGHLLVSDPPAGKVVVLDASGQELSVKRGLGQPLGLAAGDDGRIYVGDAQAGAVSVFDAQWNWIGHLGEATGEFELPGHLATFTENGVTTVLVSDGLAHCVKVYRDGARVGQYGRRGIGPDQFDFPAGICIGTNGNLFVVDQNNDRVQVLDRDGVFLRRFTLQILPGQFSASGRAQGIAADRRGWLFVADTFQGYVKVFDQTGTFLGRLGGYGEGAGQLRSPGGIAVDAADRVWVADANNGRAAGFIAVMLPPVLLWNRTSSGNLVLSWNAPHYLPEAATDLNGPWQTIFTASPFTLPAGAAGSTPQMYFRLRRQ